MTSRAPAALILAAGGGRRYGGPKALVSLGDELLVDRAVRIACEAQCTPIVVVLGASAADVVHAAALDGAVVVVNEDFASGMGSSLRCGLAALREQGASAAVVLLVDQPGVSAETIRRLTSAWQDGARAAVASYDGQPRNPVLLDATTWDEVSASAQGDIGARGWLREHTGDVRLVACDDLGNAVDIDTPADLHRLKGMEDST